MSSRKRVPVAVLSLLAVALFASTPALGRAQRMFPTRADGTCTLKAVGDEPSASGTATLSQFPVSAQLLYTFRFGMACQGLTHGAEYEVEFQGASFTLTGVPFTPAGVQ